jgi:hypothetical protein
MKFEVHTAVKTFMVFLCVAMPCGFIGKHHYFRGLCCLHVQLFHIAIDEMPHADYNDSPYLTVKSA